MKKLSILCACMVVLVLMAGPGFATIYGTDVLEPGNPGGWTASLKTFDDVYTSEPGQIVEIDIWITDVPVGANAGGLYLDFKGSTDKLTYISCQPYNNSSGGLPGPWQDAGVVVVPETGVLVVQVLQLGGNIPPDVDGDIIIAKVTLQYTAAGTAEILVGTIPGVFTWSPIPPWDDDAIPDKTLTIQECIITEDCEDDGLYCNGAPTCVDGACVLADPCPDDGLFCTGDVGCDEDNDMCTYTGNPCLEPTPVCDEDGDTCVACLTDPDCDDGLYCNGAETCVAFECVAGADPCTDDGNPCTDDCDEDTDTCYVCNAASFDDPCCLDPVCETEDICLFEVNDYYVNGTTGDNLNDGSTPATAWKTITHALTQITADEDNHANIHVAASTYDTVMGSGDAETFPLVMEEYASLLGAGHEDTIIDAQQTESVITFFKEDDIQHVTVDGFTITGGNNFRGGGFTVLWADPTISNCNITGNTSYAINGGGIYLQRSNATIENCIISDNTALQQKGGGISCGNESSPTIINCTIVDNGAGCGVDEGGGGISIGHDSSATVINTILWDNYRDCSPDPEPDQILEVEGSALAITYSCIQDGHAGDGNTDQDPNFFSTGYNLMYGSSCIDSGTSVDTPTSDINGNDRYDACFIPDTGVGPFTYYDRGAIEYQGDSDLDGILDDGDGSCSVGDNPCAGGATENCDDSCTFIPNPAQDDEDADGAGDVCDNCLVAPNGRALGTCATDITPNMFLIIGTICTGNGDCEVDEYCLMDQEDTNGNGIGDVCECESDFDCDGNVDSDDVLIFLDDFGRSPFFNPCTIEDPCNGDFDCNGAVDANDVTKFLEDFGRNQFNDPCPLCSTPFSCEY